VDHVNASSKHQEAVHRFAELYFPTLIDELRLSAQMGHKRIHSNGLEVMVHTDPIDRGWWSVQAIKHEPNGELSTSLRLKASTLERAKEVGDSFAFVSHLCNDECESWKVAP
jgi:hypothetical protein